MPIIKTLTWTVTFRLPGNAQTEQVCYTADAAEQLAKVIDDLGGVATVIEGEETTSVELEWEDEQEKANG